MSRAAHGKSTVYVSLMTDCVIFYLDRVGWDVSLRTTVFLDHVGVIGSNTEPLTPEDLIHKVATQKFEIIQGNAGEQLWRRHPSNNALPEQKWASIKNTKNKTSKTTKSRKAMKKISLRRDWRSFVQTTIDCRDYVLRENNVRSFGKIDSEIKCVITLYYSVVTVLSISTTQFPLKTPASEIRLPQFHVRRQFPPKLRSCDA